MATSGHFAPESEPDSSAQADAETAIPTIGTRSHWLAAITGGCVGILGGMIGLGGAEFRLPLLIGVFGFLALQAVILNKAF